MKRFRTAHAPACLSFILTAILFSAAHNTSALAPPENATPSHLETIRGGRHATHASIVFQFTRESRYTRPEISGNRLSFRLINSVTPLKPYRRYKTFDSWVRLKKETAGILVLIGIPDRFTRYGLVILKRPHRLVINLYIGNETKKTAPLAQELKQAPLEKKPVINKQKTVAASPGLSAQDFKRIDLVTARILSRKGLYGESIRLYRELRDRYPEDEEIWEDYIETLVNFSHYEQAISEIIKLKRKNPENLRAQRIQARIYLELRQFRWTFPVYERILSQYRNDVGVWSDYAFARQDEGQWAEALNYFSRVLELDPENTAAVRGVHEILKAHRPYLQTGYSLNVQESGDARVQTVPVRYGRHLTEQLKADVHYNRIEIDRPADIGLDAIDGIAHDAYFLINYQWDTGWEANLGAGGYNGLGNGTSYFLGAGYTPWTNAAIRTSYAWNRPWFDPVDAVSFEGSYNRWNASFDWSIGRTWGIFLGGEQWDYFVEGDRDYGRERNLTGIVTKRFSERPALSLSYAFFYSHFNFEDDTFSPIDMIPTEAAHSLSGDFEHWPCRSWAVTISGGRRWDVERNINSWYILPGIKARLGNRIQSDLSYEFNTELGTPAGGNTGTFRFSNRIIF